MQPRFAELQEASPAPPVGKAPCAFTLIELLVVIAIIAILASLLLPVLSRTKEQGRGIQCLSNMKQLSAAWVTYAGDSGDMLVTNVILANTLSWAAGWMDWSNPNETDNTNIYNLESPRGLLWPYTQSLGIYKCPSDFSTVTVQGAVVPRVRSVSLNGRMNGSDWALSPTSEFNNPNKFSAMIRPGPANLMAFIDERADSIDDAYFGVDMLDSNAEAQVINMPANYHLGCSSISFGDGHAEVHRWMDPRTEPSMVSHVMIFNSGYVHAPNDVDVAWLQQHSTSPR